MKGCHVHCRGKCFNERAISLLTWCHVRRARGIGGEFASLPVVRYCVTPIKAVVLAYFDIKVKHFYCILSFVCVLQDAQVEFKEVIYIKMSQTKPLVNTLSSVNKGAFVLQQMEDDEAYFCTYYFQT